MEMVRRMKELKMRGERVMMKRGKMSIWIMKNWNRT